MCPGKIYDILKRENSTFGRFPECLFWKKGDFLETYEKEKNHCVSWSDPLRDCRMSGKKNDGGVYTAVILFTRHPAITQRITPANTVIFLFFIRFKEITFLPKQTFREPSKS